jgi:beta-galactosidase
LKGDGEETTLIAVDSLDDKGRFVPTATNGISFAIKGPGKILGVGNGDPSSHESDIEPTRHLFNGKALVIVQSTGGAGTIELIASGQGLQPAVLSLSVKDVPRRPSVP